MEVVEWQENGHGLQFTMRLLRATEWNIVLSILHPVDQVIVEGKHVEHIHVNKNVLEISLKMQDSHMWKSFINSLTFLFNKTGAQRRCAPARTGSGKIIP